jgi:hypothetical protein
MPAISGNPVVPALRSAQHRFDGFWSQDSTGAYYFRRTFAIGDNLRIPPSLKGGRVIEFIVIAADQSLSSAGIVAPESAWDTLAQLTIVPRVLHVPNPS